MNTLIDTEALLRECEERIAVAESVATRLAEKAGTSVDNLRGLFNKAKTRFPETEADFQAVNVPNLIGKLNAVIAKRRVAAEKNGDSAARRVTHIRQIGNSAATPSEMMEWVSDPRLRSFAKSFDPFVSGGALLLGQTGLGKSVACFILMHRFITRDFLSKYDTELNNEEGRVASWASFDALDLGLAQQKTPLGEPESGALSLAKSADVLILDDLGWERRFHVDTLIELAASRYNKGRPTIVTSGKTQDELRSVYGDAVLRRFMNVDGKPGAIVDCWSDQNASA